MLKFLLSLILLFNLVPVYGALNESTKPTKINVYIDQNPPFSNVDNHELVSGIFVDYWHEWSRLSGIDVVMHPYSEKDLSFLEGKVDPTVYSGLKIPSSLSQQVVKQSLFTVYGHFYFLNKILPNDLPMRIGGLLPGAQQFSFITKEKGREYAAYPGLFELIKALYEKKVDAIVLFDSESKSKSVLSHLLSYLLHEIKLSDSSQKIFVYGAFQQKNTLEWINWGSQFINDSDGVTMALTNSANSIFGASAKIQRNVAFIICLVILFVIYNRYKRKKDLQFKTLIDDSPYPLAIFSLDGSVIYYLNNEALSLLPTKKNNDTYVFKEEGNHTVFKEFIEKENHKVVIDMATIQLLIDGHFFDLEISGKKVYYRKKTAWLCYLKDINNILQTESQLVDERELLRTVLNSIPEQVLFTSPKGIILSCNEAWANANGTTVSDATGNDITNVIASDLIDIQKKQEISVWNGKKLNSQEWTQKKNNELNLINSTKLPLYKNNKNGVFGLLSIESDITDVYNLNKKIIDENIERKKVEMALARQNTLLTTVFAASIDPIGLLDQDGRVIGANDAFAILMGYSNSDDIVGKLQSEFLSAERSDWVDIQNKNVLESEKPLIFDELIFFEGKKIWYEVSKMPFKDEDNDFKGIIIMARDISLHKQTEEKLTSAASDYEVKMLHDQLTGIPNRRAFDIQFEMFWKEAKDEQELLSIVMCDIDFFKLYNDNYGHQKGDVALKQVAQVLQKTANELGVFVARYGGEEFVVLSKGGNATKALKNAEILRKAVANEKIEHLHSVTSHSITMSMGLSNLFPSNLNTMAMLLAEADSALYESKKHGRNQVGVH